jgi:hypothetical protein
MDTLTGLQQLAAGALGPLGPLLGPYGGRLAGATVILVVAWLAARLVRAALVRAATAAHLDNRLRTPGLAAMLANIGYWLVWLFALPALLGSLQIDGLLAPVNAMMSRMLGFLPNLMGALVILGAGLLAARIVGQLLTGVLTAAGSEKLAARVGLGTALGDKTLAGLTGQAVSAFILLPTLVAALQALGLDIVAKPVAALFDTVVELIPRLISAAAIVAIGAIAGRVLAGLLTALLAGFGFNRLPARLGIASGARFGGRDASELAGSAVMVAAVLMALTQAFDVIGFPVLTRAAEMLGGVLANLAVALIVLGAGLWLAQAAAAMVEASTIARARRAAQVVRVTILFFFVALALRQAGLPGDIIVIAFGAVVGGLALGTAIAVGLGGRKVASRLLEAAVSSFEAEEPDARLAGPLSEPPGTAATRGAP